MRIHWSVKKRLIRLFGPRFKLKKRFGILFLLDSHNWIDTRLLIGQPYEDAQLQAFSDLMDQTRPEIFLDIGANIGLYSLFFAKKDYLKEIHCFEPVSQNFVQLKANLLVNGLLGRVAAHQLALSATNSQEIIHIDPRSTGVSRIDLGSRREDVFTSKEEINLIRMDDHFQWEDKCIFMKIDVEGHESQAIIGMENVLKKNRVLMQLECFSSDSDILAHLKESGFKTIRNLGDDYYLTNFDLNP